MYILNIPFIFWVQSEWPIAVVMNCDPFPKHLLSLPVAYHKDSDSIEFPPRWLSSCLDLVFEMLFVP
jgi:hypothetical protein